MKENNDGVKQPPADFSTAFHSFMHGQLAASYVVGKDIEQAMKPVNDKTLSRGERAAAAQKAYKDLSSLADGFRYKQTIPDSVYKQMKLTDAYISDEHTGNTQALAQLDAALATLKTYQ
jgi:hypothetical protein